MSRLFFKKKLHLLTNLHFQNVYKRKRTINTKIFTILVCHNDLFCPRLGILISKKNVKRACDRNRIKRLIKESFRLFQNSLMVMDFLVIVKKNLYLFSNKKIFFYLKNKWIYKKK